MRVFIVILLVGVAASNPAPQLGDLFSSFTDALAGDDEPGEVNGDYKAVPYTTIQKFKGYEEREYPSVKWACTELTYTPDAEDDVKEQLEEQTIIKDVHEAVQIHLRSEQGEERDPHDSARALEENTQRRRLHDNRHVFLHRPGEPEEPSRA